MAGSLRSPYGMTLIYGQLHIHGKTWMEILNLFSVYSMEE